MNRPCPNTISCPGSDDPFQNLSSEQPDGLDFLGFAYQWGEGWGSPPNQQQWTLTACGIVLSTSTSPFDAQLQAIAQAIACAIGRTNPGRAPIFTNNTQTCGVPAPHGGTSFFTVGRGTIQGLNQQESDTHAQAIACYFARQHVLSLSTIQNACLSQGYNQTITVTGGAAPYSLDIVSGALPPGLLAQQSATNSLTIFGIPTMLGDFPIVVQAFDSSGAMVETPITLSVLGLVAQPSPGTIGTPYSFQLQSGGGALPFTFAIESGLVPPGLTLSSSGLISGTPTSAFNQSALLLISDSTGSQCVQTINFSILLSGFAICNWAGVVLPAMTFPAGHNSSKPAWNGVFNVSPPSPDNLGPYWTFFGQSIAGKAFAPDDGAPDYPNGDWVDNDCYCQLFWNGVAWLLFFRFAGGATGGVCNDPSNLFYVFNGGTSTNPTGTYTQINSVGITGPANIEIGPAANPCCPDWTKTSWTAPILFQNATASASGNSLSASCSNAGGAGPTVQGMVGTLNYSGGACTSTLTVKVTAYNFPGIDGEGGIRIRQAGNVVLVVRFRFEMIGVGTYVFPFNLIAANGTNITIDGSLNLAGQQTYIELFNGDTSQLAFTATLS